MTSEQQPQTIRHGKAFSQTVSLLSEAPGYQREGKKWVCICAASVLPASVDVSLNVCAACNYRMAQEFFPQDPRLIQCMGWRRVNRKGSCSALFIQFLATPFFSANLPQSLLHPEVLAFHGIHHKDIYDFHKQEWIYLARQRKYFMLVYERRHKQNNLWQISTVLCRNANC